MGDLITSDQDQARRTVLRAVVVAVGLGLAGPFVFFGLSEIVGELIPRLSPLAQAVLSLGFLVAGPYIAFVGVPYAYYKYRGMGWGEIRSSWGLELPSLRDLLAVAGGYAAIFVLILIVGVIIQAIGAQPAENQTGEVAREVPALIPYLIVYMFLVVGPCEEILYRGTVQGRARETLGAVPSIVIASAVFAPIHWFALTGGASGRLLTIGVLFVPSLVFGAVYEYTENVTAVALLHAIHNSILLVLLYVSIQMGGPTVALPI